MAADPVQSLRADLETFRAECLETISDILYRINGIHLQVLRSVDRLAAHSTMLETLCFRLAVMESKAEDTDVRQECWLVTMD